MKVSLKQISTDEQLYIWAMQQLKTAFPPSERRDDLLQRQVMTHPDYKLCAILDGAIPVGVVGFWDTANFVYFENFCVSPELRNRGYGSATLKLLTSTSKPFILEIELPQDAISCRRKAFYERCGMVENPFKHIQPHYRKTDPDLPLIILTYGKQITQQQYDEFRKYLDDYVDVR